MFFYLNRISETTVQVIQTRHVDEDVLGRLIDGVPLKTFLQPTLCSPADVVRIRHIMLDINDELAMKEAAGKARQGQSESTFARIAREIVKLSPEERRAVAMLAENQGASQARRIVEGHSTH